MARNRRFFRPRRRDANYTWQSYPEKVRVSIPSSNPVYHGVFSRVFIPGIGKHDHNDLVPFTNEHTMERVVGAMAHNASGFDVNEVPWIGVTLADRDWETTP